MADDIASNVVVTMLEPIRDILYKFIGDRFGYLFHCKKNIKEFEKELKNLNDQMKNVQTSVDAAKNNAEVIEDNVTTWLTQVETLLPTMEQDKERLLLATQNLKCLHLCSRYRLGKDGKKNTTVVTNLIKDANFGPSVGHRPPLTGIWHRTDTINYESFQSRESVFKAIMETLKDDRHFKIGIHGMPGVGKTKMMKEVAQQAQKERLFDEIVETVVTQNPTLKDIQQELAEALNLKLDQVTKGARKELLRNRLKNGKKILLMVDDVWDDKIKLEDIGIPSVDDHTHGCKIILTSRIKDVCIRMGVQNNCNFEIGVLSECEAWDLFKKTVGDSTEHPELHSVAEEVCSECHRLPLAIVTIGAALRYEEASHAWNDALHQLKHSKGKNIPGVTEKLYSCIELSYKYLKQKDLQSCFLHCCLFPEDAEISIDNLVTYGVATRFLEGTNRASMETARNRTRHLVDTLKKSNLLSNANDENFVKMHDVIRDVAISIASEEKDAMFLVKDRVEKWPDEDEYKHCKTISLRFKDDCVLSDDLECTKVCTLMLEFRKLSSEVPSTFFKGMEKLQVLHLHKTLITTLPSSLKNLRMLHLYKCKLVNVAFLGELRKLEILIIVDYALEELASEIGQLTRLRLLDLRRCYKLKIIPSSVISSLSQLEELYISNEFDQWEVKDNASLDELNSLTRLISLQVHVPNVELLLLNELLFKSLIKFKISIGSKFMPGYVIRSSATRILKLVGFPLKKRELNILIKKADVLHLIQLKGLKDVFHDRYGEGFQELEDLQVKDCDDEMEYLLDKPKWINSQSNQLCASGGSFSKLSELEVINCPLMKYLFSAATARGLPQLQRLCIDNCEMLEEIVGDIEQEVVMDTITFHQLKSIKLKRLPNMRIFYGNTKKMSTRGCTTSTLAQALFNDKVRFPALEELEINELKSLTAIWDNQLLLGSGAQDSFRQLRLVDVNCCEKLVNIIPPNAIPMLQILESLEIVSCDSLISGVEVTVIEEGSDEILMFSQLKKLILKELPKLNSFFCSRRGGEERVAEGSNIRQPQALFNHKVRFLALEKLEINDLESLTAIWDNKLFLDLKGEDSFQQLRNINVQNCQKLVNIIPPNVLPLLQGLEILQVSKVSRVEVIVAKEDSDGIVVFPRLKTMRLEILPNLKSFCWSRRGGEDMVQEENNIPQQQALFNREIAFPALEKLEIVELGSLTAIWDDQLQSVLEKEAKDSFRRLMYMKVFQCEKLVNVIPSNMLPRLQNLEKLKVSKCDSVLVMYIRFNRLCVYSNLTDLHLSNRDSMENAFSPSTARYLVHLQKLTVENCKKMEEIVVVERGQLGEEDVVHDDDIIVFLQLKVLKLGNLPNLKSFCSCTRESKKQEEETVEKKNISRVEALFNHKIRLPALEELKINDLESLTAIWDNELFLGLKEEKDSFQRLRNINVQKCRKLVNIIPSNVLPLLQGLEILEVSKVSRVEVIVTEEGSDGIIVFPRLKTMRLEILPNLKSFCWSGRGGEDGELEENNIPQQQALFNHKIRLPALEELKINELKSLTAIWDNQILLGCGAQDSFRQLRLVDVNCCEKLVNVIPPNAIPMLQILESLKIVSCDSLISGVEVTAIEEGSDEILMFSQLKMLILKELPKLNSFCCSRRGGEESVAEESNIGQPQALFNHKVQFPMLEKLVCDGSIFEGIWLGHLGTGSLCKVRVIEMEKYNNIVNGCRLLQWFKVVEEVRLESCYSLEVMFNLEGVDDVIQRKAIIVMSSQLKELRLIDLPNLKCIWKTDPRGRLLMFHNLTYLRVRKCNSLRYLFSLSIARRLTQLRNLEIRSCDAMEEIVVKNEEQGEEDSTDEIVFSQLEVLWLMDLAKLTSFCGANNAAFKFPSLHGVVLKKCPELQTFVSGGISTRPVIRVFGGDRQSQRVSELNKYVEQQYVGKGKGLQTVDNEDEGTSS